jgi:DNA-binding IclR family transcriptional regulator
MTSSPSPLGREGGPAATSTTLHSMSTPITPAGGDEPRNHRTIDRVTKILEEVVYHPGISFAELARALDAPKSSVHGFIRGLQAQGWLYEDNRRFYLGPAVFSLTLASGHIRAGLVTQADLDALHEETGLAVFLGVESGDKLIYIGESGTDVLSGFAARSNIRRELVSTAGGKVLLTERPDVSRETYLRKAAAIDPQLVADFLSEYDEIVRSRIATNLRYGGAQKAIATAVRNQSAEVAGTVVLIGPTTLVERHEARVRKALLRHVDAWATHRVTPREAI